MRKFILVFIWIYNNNIISYFLVQILSLSSFFLHSEFRLSLCIVPLFQKSQFLLFERFFSKYSKSLIYYYVNISLIFVFSSYFQKCTFLSLSLLYKYTLLDFLSLTKMNSTYHVYFIISIPTFLAMQLLFLLSNGPNCTDIFLQKKKNCSSFVLLVIKFTHYLPFQCNLLFRPSHYSVGRF